jgi:HlyD family secretion protein
MKLNKQSLIISVPVIVAVIAIIFLLTKSFGSEEIIITGIVETTEVDVASKIPGRVETIFVKEGDTVKKGDVLAVLESKEMDAKVEQARGVMEAAKARMTMVRNGARAEEKEATEKMYQQAKAQFDYAAKTWTRFQSLYKDKVISNQEKDEMEFKYSAAKDQMDAAKAKLVMVMKGARYEEIDAVESLFHQAENAFNEATAYQKELELKAPIDGEVFQSISDEGEVINSGYPVFTLLKSNDSFIVLQIREDLMSQIKSGRVFYGKVPALGNKEYEFEVSYIAPMADFATWKPTNQKGEFDLKTFEIHLRSKNSIKGLRPGMTVNIKLH